MVARIKKSITNSKNKATYAKRNKQRVDRKKKQKNFEKNKYVDKRELKEQKLAAEAKESDDEDLELSQSSDDDLEKELAEEQAQMELMKDENIDETEFDKFAGGELDLPEEDSSDEAADEDLDLNVQIGDEDPDLDDYYRELGIEPEDMPKSKATKAQEQDQLYRTQKKEKKRQEASRQTRERSAVIEQIIEKARTQPNVQTLNRIIQIVKTVFGQGKQVEAAPKKGGKDQEDEEMKDASKAGENRKIFSQMLGQVEYQTLLNFFATELPTQILKLANVREFPQVEKLSGATDGKKKKKEQASSFDVKKEYAKVTAKHQILLKSYAANFNKLLTQAISEESAADTVSSSFLVQFFSNGADVARCCIPFKMYAKKLAFGASKVCVSYSKVDKSAIVLAFNAIRCLVSWSQDETLFEATLKRLYNEFTAQSRIGGGGFAVQDRLRISQNCFIELLSWNRAIGYQLGFQYLRQLCLHLRNLRNNLTKDAVKNIYSWQFYNCMKLWVLALTNASTSDLALLVHPLVQLIVGVLRLTINIKYFPFHLKCFELLTTINEKTGQFVPAVQYILYPFDSANINFFNGKPKALTDKMIPETVISLKIAKKHLETQEMKDRIIKDAIEALTLYLSANAASLSFPELMVPITVLLAKFKKNTTNSGYRKSIQAFLELVKRNEEAIAQARSKIKDKSLRDPAKLHQQFQLLVSRVETPLGREQTKIQSRRAEQMQRKMDQFNKR